ncbi:creatininase family protein [Acetobacteraceae bacterium ESL0709]|nr:creatininase family protein [Acetobacteraceae bacterium ESL0697]MDF7678945.1 creatininase family protein [Acetobacteraceae bacterium ESL0709]
MPGRILFFCLSVIVWSVPALAQSCGGKAGGVELACHTWTEIDQALKAGKTTIIVPVGGTEQSGPYVAVGKHNIRAQMLADEIASRLGDCFVAPVIAYVPEGSTSPRSSHMRFPGTLSVSPTVFEGVLTGAAESLRVQGFRTIVFLGDHGGYQKELSSLADRLNIRWKKAGVEARILHVKNFYDVIPGEYAQKLRAMGLGAFLGKHADLSDTSLMLAVDPSLVRINTLKQAPKPAIEDGVYGGDPRPATAELGRIGTDMQIDAAVRSIEIFNRSLP